MRSLSKSRLHVLSAVLALAALAAGCTGKLTAENYTRVSNGMTQAQVEAILGPGSEQASSGVAVPAMPAGAPSGGATGIGAPGTTVTTKVLVWRKGSKMITATFMNDQLVAKTQVGLD